MKALTYAETDYHPRSSGPPYGAQFQKLHDAWYRMSLHVTQGQPIHWLAYGDVEIDFILYCDTEAKSPRSGKVYLYEDIYEENSIDGDEPIYEEMITQQGTASSRDELIKQWWEHVGQFDTSPWDPNGIVTARRIGLTRQEKEPIWEVKKWHNYHKTDKLSFEAFDRGDYSKMKFEEVWNSVNQLGFTWTVQ